MGRLASFFSELVRCDFFANLREPQAAFAEDVGGEALLFAQQAEQQMLRADVLVIQALGFFRAVGEHAFALVAAAAGRPTSTPSRAE